MTEDSARLLTELEELRAEANALTARLSAHHDPRSRYTGEDPNGMARVIVDGRGRTTDVAVTRGWRHDTDPPGLARALLTAYDEAQARRLEAVATGGAPLDPFQPEGRGPSTPRLTWGHHPPEGEVAKGSPLDHRAAQAPFDAHGPDLIRDLLPLLDRAERQLDDACRQLSDHFCESARLAGTNNEMTITVRGGQVTEIDFARQWIESASADEVASAVRRLFQLAHDRAWTAIGELVPPELGELMSFAADPERMLRQLGLGS